MRRYDHIGIPTDVPRAGEVYLERYDLYCTDHEGNPFGIQWMRYGPGCPLPKLVKSMTHVAFEVDDLAAELVGREVIIAPSCPSNGVLTGESACPESVREAGVHRDAGRTAVHTYAPRRAVAGGPPAVAGPGRRMTR